MKDDTCGSCGNAEPTEIVSGKDRTLNMIWCPIMKMRFTPDVHKLCSTHEIEEEYPDEWIK